MTSAGETEPVDLPSLRATDALFDRLAERAPDPSGDHDAAVRLLRSLLDDLDRVPGSAGEAAFGLAEPVDLRQRRRSSRGVRTAVAVGVASAVLATTGVAAAGGGWPDRDEPTRSSPHNSTSTPRLQPKRAAKTPPAPAPQKTPEPPKAVQPKPTPIPSPMPTKKTQQPVFPSGAVQQSADEIREIVEQHLRDGSWR
ncbi:hypothetical protein GCM10027589_29180 [Actinocorallia lasiicapitis]